MKDYFDIWLLSHRFDFKGESLAKAIAETFARRKTDIPLTIPVGLGLDFASDLAKQNQWKAFWRKAVRTEPTPNFEDVVEKAGGFLLTAAQAVRTVTKWQYLWIKGGPWRLLKNDESKPN